MKFKKTPVTLIVTAVVGSFVVFKILTRGPSNFKIDHHDLHVNYHSFKIDHRNFNFDQYPCESGVWCHVKMPLVSHYGFDPPHDERKWHEAQKVAASGDQVFLKYIREHITHPLDFIDGDTSFRSYHKLFDIFVDKKHRLNELHHLTDKDIEHGVSMTSHVKIKKATKEDIHLDPKLYVPPLYDFRTHNRAPVVALGYGLFKRSGMQFFAGESFDYYGLEMKDFLQEWNVIKNDITTPFIAICQGNENWGCLSTQFPNRTTGWGKYWACDDNQDQCKLLHEFLNHKMTLALIVNQHHNITHPKVLTLPRGLPITWTHTESLVMDSIEFAYRHLKKSTALLHASGSDWGPRPQILKCISQHLIPELFIGHTDIPIKVSPQDKQALRKRKRHLYYRTLATARFGLALPGLGYDCFRTWEIMTMGAIVVIERGIGLDRTLWRLPALLVDDFSDITEELLRSAYVEAVYRAADFEYERLKQSYYWETIATVSRNMSSYMLYTRFPMRAQDIHFTRPRTPHNCSHIEYHKNHNIQCGKSTKRTPAHMC